MSYHGGDNNKVKDAKNTILYAIVGLIVAILGYAIVNWVVSVLEPAPLQRTVVQLLLQLR